VVVFGICFGSAVFAQEAEPIEGFPDHLLYSQFPGNADGTDPLQQHIALRRTWENGQVLNVCFFGGDVVTHHLIAAVASEWDQYANLKFNFGELPNYRDCTSPNTGFSQIRVGF